MTPQAASAAHARGTAIRNARTLRVRQIRRRVISGAGGLFAAVWLLITLVLVTGHDPALARLRAANSSSASVSAAGTTSSPKTTAISTRSSGSSAVKSSKTSAAKSTSSPAAATTSSGSSASPVTSRQS